MDLQTILGFGIAVSMPVWLVIEEVARRRGAGPERGTARRANPRRERQTVGGLKRPVPAVSRQMVSHLSVAAGG